MLPLLQVDMDRQSPASLIYVAGMLWQEYSGPNLGKRAIYFIAPVHQMALARCLKKLTPLTGSNHSTVPRFLCLAHTQPSRQVSASHVFPGLGAMNEEVEHG
jgi:hypothetical protein